MLGCVTLLCIFSCILSDFFYPDLFETFPKQTQTVMVLAQCTCIHLYIYINTEFSQFYEGRPIILEIGIEIGTNIYLSMFIFIPTFVDSKSD